jgi:hypothetical protein
MDATTYTGNGTNPRSITNSASFKPDFVWVKTRSVSRNHVLFDSVRGAGSTKGLFSNLTDAEGGSAGNETSVYGYLSSFNSDGFSTAVGSTNNNYYNTNADTYVAWQWQAGQGVTSSNTNGSITSTVSVNATAGFSVVTYTGNGSTGTVGHGLGVAPSFILVKNRTSTIDNWQVYHSSLGNTQRLTLNTTNAADAPSPGMWNSTSPTSSVFSVGNQTGVNAATTYVAYCWAPVAGFSQFGSYTGNGSTDGPFVYTGFRPRYVMFKRTDTGGAGFDWYIVDTVRNTYNASGTSLWADLPDAEVSGTFIDILSNGFKFRGTSTGYNGSGGTYIYACFAENPFKYALAR